MASCPPSGAPIAHGRAGVAWPAPPACCSAPCGTWSRSGGRAAGRRRRSPSPRSPRAGARRCAASPRSGSLRPIGSNCTPSERGKNSYQDPYSARSRSTSTGYRPDLVTSSRSGYPARIAADLARLGRRQPVPGRHAAVAQLPGERVERGPGRGGPGGAGRLPDRPGRPLEQQRALGQHQLDVLAARDLDAGVVVPGRDRIAPRLDLEMPGALVGHGDLGAVPVRPRRQLAHPHQRAGPPAGSRSTTPAPSTPCPSLMTVALTWKVSPATALAGRRPQSTTGWTSRMGMRPITPSTVPSLIREFQRARGCDDPARNGPRARPAAAYDDCP